MKPLIAVLSQDGRIECGTSLSITQNVRYCDVRGIVPTVHYQVKCCYLPLARNTCIDVLLKDPEYTDIVFVDSDLVFDVSAIHRLLSCDCDVVAAAYRYKYDEQSYPVSMVLEPDSTPHVERSLIEAYHVPTGLMRIRRSAIEYMIKMYPSLKLNNGSYSLFDTGALWGDGVWHGEDVAFCRRFRQVGGRIWIVPDVDIAHVGSKEYIGNFHRYMVGRPRPGGVA